MEISGMFFYNVGYGINIESEILTHEAGQKRRRSEKQERVTV